MEIRVPRTPKESFNKHRPVSDLIRKQVEHFQHVESKLSDAQRRTLPQGHIRTEHEAAEYIAAMTQLLHSKPAADAQPLPAPIVMPNRPPAPARGLEIAAASEKPAAKSPNRATPRSRKPRKGKKG
jgi:hypothetical protein